VDSTLRLVDRTLGLKSEVPGLTHVIFRVQLDTSIEVPHDLCCKQAFDLKLLKFPLCLNDCCGGFSIPPSPNPSIVTVQWISQPN